jgi:hypothetical protein
VISLKLADVSDAPDSGSPHGDLEVAISGISRLQGCGVPLFGGLFAKTKLLEACRDSLGSERAPADSKEPRRSGD